ncbi:MAG: ribonuclease E/G [Lachnospiraceae bacterium]|nr:ribonuclease E/G [Lachnospiraceae bacterium]
MSRYLITKYQGAVLCGLWEDDCPQSLSLYPEKLFLSSGTGEERIGDIYIAKVKKILPAQRAAFADIRPGHTCFLPLDRGSVLYADGRRSEKDCSDLREGAEILVQIRKAAHANKKPELTGYFDLEEYDDPRAAFRRITETAATRTCYSRIWTASAGPVRELLRLNAEELEMIRIDDPAICEALRDDPFLKDAGLDKLISLYTDDYPMGKLYSVESALEAALSRRVRLRSGAELVIEHTEAFWTVDVNSGKSGASVKGMDKEDAVLATNIGAVRELARQMRLRNMSGIVVCDLINMTLPGSREQVISALGEACEGDPAGVHIGGFTGFGLLELSRKRIRPALYEQAASFGIKTRSSVKKNP